MATLQNEFIVFHDNIKLGIYDEEQSLRDKRDELLEELKESLKDEKVPDSDRLLTFNKLDQGSYAMSTGIIPYKGDYDIDVAVCFDIDKSEYDSHKLKTLVYEKLSDKKDRTVVFKRPCISVNYSDDYHVDLVIYTKNDNANDMYIAWGKQYVFGEQCWYEADPKGLTKWVQDVSSITEQRDQFRRCVRALKKWKQMKFISTGNAAPASIGLTIQARNTFQYDKDNDLNALIRIVQNIKDSFQQTYDADDEVFDPYHQKWTIH